MFANTVESISQDVLNKALFQTPFKKKKIIIILPLALTSSQTQSVCKGNIPCEVQPNTQKRLETFVHKIRIFRKKGRRGLSSENKVLSYVMSHELNYSSIYMPWMILRC